jgi:Methyltransferase FkbM domain
VFFGDSRADDQNAVGTSGTGVRVPLRPLDTLDVPAGAIALLKVDVEGYEEPVFRGGAATLARTACVYFESWETLCARYGRTSTTVLDLLTTAGFALYRFGADQSLSPVPASHVSVSCENLLAVRDSSSFFARWNANAREGSGGSPFR